MKKAKIILAVVAVFSAVGGAFAFKAAFLAPNVYTLTTTRPGGPIVCTTTGFVTTAPALGAATTTYIAPNCQQLVQTFITAADR